MAGRRGKQERARVTLRGLVLPAAVCRDGEEEICVGWERVSCSSNPDTGQVTALHAWRVDGTAIRAKGIGGFFRVPTHDGAVARKLIGRRQKRIFDGCGVTVTERFGAGAGDVAAIATVSLLSIGLAVVITVEMIEPELRGFWSNPWQDQLMTLAVVAMWMSFMAIPAIAMLVIARPIVRRNVNEIRMGTEGIDAVLKDGSRVRRLWRDVRDIKSSVGFYQVMFVDGVTLRFSPKLTWFWLAHLRKMLMTAVDEAVNRMWLHRLVGYFQVGGVVAGVAQWWAAGHYGAANPLMQGFQAYLMVGVAMPAMLLASIAVKLLLARLDRWWSRRKRNRARWGAARGSRAED